MHYYQGLFGPFGKFVNVYAKPGSEHLNHGSFVLLVKYYEFEVELNTEGHIAVTNDNQLKTSVY